MELIKKIWTRFVIKPLVLHRVKKAAKQRELERFKSIKSYVRDERYVRLLSALLNLLKLPQNIQFFIATDLCLVKNELGGLAHITYICDEYSGVSLFEALARTLSEAFFNMEDDGCLDLIEVELEGKWPNNAIEHTVHETRYFLSDAMYDSTRDSAELWLKNAKEKINPLHNLTIKSCKAWYFSKLDQFTDFIEFIGNKANYSKLDYLYPGKVLSFIERHKLNLRKENT